MIFDKMFGFFSNDMGIDLGTANTLVYVKGRGIVLHEPSVVAINTDTGKVMAVGTEAKKMLGRTPSNIRAIRPMKDGVIADFETVQKMIRYFIRKVNNNRRPFIKPRLVIGIPTGITEVERRAVKESAEQAGTREIYLIEESLAAAIGANIPIEEPAGHMVIDIGGGTTEVSVISLGSLVISNTIRVGGDDFDDTIMLHVRKVHNLNIGERTAEDIKISIGNAFPGDEVMNMEVRGRDTITGLPRTLTMDSEEIRECLQDPINQVLEVVKTTLDQTPPELAADIVDRGIIMTGGGSLLKGFSTFISKETGVPVFLAENPLTCVVLGAGRFLDQLPKVD